MTRQRTTHALLAVVAVLLALNLAAELPWPTAQAQPEMAMPPPRLVAMAWSGGITYRMWSDGVVEFRRMSIAAGVSFWHPSDSEWREVVHRP